MPRLKRYQIHKYLPVRNLVIRNEEKTKISRKNLAFLG
jgi:hypothetical protein